MCEAAIYKNDLDTVEHLLFGRTLSFKNTQIYLTNSVDNPKIYKLSNKIYPNIHWN